MPVGLAEHLGASRPVYATERNVSYTIPCVIVFTMGYYRFIQIVCFYLILPHFKHCLGKENDTLMLELSFRQSD